jgi:restriction system protein
MLFTILILVFALAVIVLKNWSRSAKGKGQIGEFVVARMLAQLGPGYEVLNDLTFVVEGDSTQIDHVVVSTKGVFLIETKNYAGLIFGQANEGQWTQAMGRTKNRFQNPLRQNFKHVKFLSQKLEVKESAIVPLVVFIGGPQFPKGQPEGVYFPRELVKAIGSATDARLNNAQTFTIRRRLEELGATTAAKTEKHLANLEAKHGKPGR